MVLRRVHTVLIGGNCFLGLLLLGLYGPLLLHTRAWPPSLVQGVLVLIAVPVLPFAVLSMRFPLVAGIAQFSTACIGHQLLREAPLPELRAFSSISMLLALVILAVAVFRGIFAVTREAFGEAEPQDKNRAVGAA